MGTSFQSNIIVDLLPHVVMDMTVTLGLALSNENFRSVQLSIKGSQKCNFTVDTIQAWLLFKCVAADFQQALSVNEVTIL